MGRKKLRSRSAATRAGLGKWIWLGLGGVILAAAGLVALAAWQGGKTSAAFTPEATGRAKLKADQQQVDLGNVRLGQTVAVAFELTNVGDKPLRFTDQPYVEVVEGC